MAKMNSRNDSDPSLRVHVVCAGFIFGNGERNDIFYEFFRRAWVSLHPELAALPIKGNGSNHLPTIHVSDLTDCIDFLLTSGDNCKGYLVAVDQSKNSSQKQIFTSISEVIGTGQTKSVKISEVIDEPWCEFVTVDVSLKTSECFIEAIQWRFPQGINKFSMPKLNEEFNFFRGLFPLKVFITGPPCSGKSFFGQKIADEYGIPHLTIKDVIKMGMELTNDFGQRLKNKIEELKDIAETEYEKTRKKKDPDFDRANYNPRLTDDLVHDLVKYQLKSPACMNKGFILDGIPKSKSDCKEIFMDKIEIKPAAGEEANPDVEP